MDFIKWFKHTKLGFIPDSQVPDHVRPSLNEYLIKTNKVGIYVSKLFLEDESLYRIEMGYYVRSRNPFKWQFRRTYGNHHL